MHHIAHRLINHNTGLVPVQFLRDATPYRNGEIAGFDVDQSVDLVSRGLAVFYDSGKHKPADLVDDPSAPPSRLRIPGPDHVEIPEAWNSLPKPEIITLAKTIMGVDDIQLSMAQAREAIEAELKRREANNGQDEE